VKRSFSILLYPYTTNIIIFPFTLCMLLYNDYVVDNWYALIIDYFRYLFCNTWFVTLIAIATSYWWDQSCPIQWLWLLDKGLTELLMQSEFILNCCVVQSIMYSICCPLVDFSPYNTIGWDWSLSYLVKLIVKVGLTELLTCGWFAFTYCTVQLILLSTCCILLKVDTLQ